MVIQKIVVTEIIDVYKQLTGSRWDSAHLRWLYGCKASADPKVAEDITSHLEVGAY